MKVAILCGGMGTRLGEETYSRPKPMVEIGRRPILWHIMQLYAAQGFTEFALALGYRGDVIKDYFLTYRGRNSDFTVDLAKGHVEYLNHHETNWRVTLTDTGSATMTGGRVRRMRELLRREGTFMLTYGDGVADVDLADLLAFHRSHGRIATLTTVRPPARFGNVTLDGDVVTEFKEKPQAGAGWINGGFFVFEPEVFDYIDGDDTVLEGKPLERLSAEGQLLAYRHEGFWQCMDTIRDRDLLEARWASGDAPWKLW